MFAGMTTHDLVECLEQIPPAELKGLELLKRLRLQTGEWFPARAPAEDVITATQQIINYTTTCEAAAARLSNLSPIILPNVMVPEFAI